MAIYRLLEAFVLISILTLADGACENCANCLGSNTCLQCNNGFYLVNGICRLCQDGCVYCNSETRCDQCLVGFYLDSDTGSCNLCRPECVSCDSFEKCRICEATYFPDDGKCLNCPNKCSTCVSSIYCTSCDQGYWGSTNCSNSCPVRCINRICDLQGYCRACPDGMWGKECQYPCRANCLNDKCSTAGDTCTDGCMPGFYGKNCEKSCPNTCKTNICSRNGHCTTGCKPGFYGDYCNQTCLSTTCPDNECFQNNGSCKTSCPETCLSCTSLTICTSCKEGHYGTICENQCPDSNCKECFQGTGTCLKCNNGFFLSGTVCIGCSMECKTCEGPTSSNCLSCTKGNYLDGNQCKTCNDGCSDCSWYDNCSECQAGYFLETSECTRCRPNCKTCTSTNICTSCIDGYQGITCDSFVCADQKYSTSLGTDSCECDKQKCSNKNGATCQSCTDSGWYPSGPGCCPCADGTYENNGVCVTCPEHCIPKGQCNVSTGACERCEDQWWGFKCDQRCNNTCESCLRDLTCNQSIAGGGNDPATTPAARPSTNEMNGSNTVIIAAAGGGGAVILIIIIVVVIICVVRRKSSKKTSEQQQNGNVTTQNGGIADNGNNDSEDEYTMNAMYVPVTETQIAAKGYTPSVQYDNRFSLDDERNTTDVDTGHYSFVDKSGNKAETTLDLHVNQYENYRDLVDADSSTNEVSETGHYSYVDKSRKAGEQGKEAVYSVPKKPRKVES